MKTTSAQIRAVVSNQREIAWRSPRLARLLVAAVAVVLVARASPVFSQQPATAQAPQSTSIPDVKCVIGLETFKPDTKGTLSLLPTGLEFATGKNKADIPPLRSRTFLRARRAGRTSAAPQAQWPN